MQQAESQLTPQLTPQPEPQAPPVAQHDAERHSLAEQAAHWVVQMSSDDPAECQAARLGFDAWKQADPRHAAAAERLQDLISRMQQLRTGEAGHRPARAALDAAFNAAADRKTGNQARLRTRKLKRLAVSAALALLLGLPGWLVWHAYPPSYLLADVRTGTGQWQSRVLDDGSRITLNSTSAVNLRYYSQRRVLQLLQGEILVDVAKDPQRPFVVQTAQGSIRALGTRFVVSAEADDSTVLSMLESRVQVRTAEQNEAQSGVAEVVAGQRVRITAQQISAPEAIDVRSIDDAWKYHQLVLQGQSLPEVLDMLNRYRPGMISYNREQIASLHVAAVLPLDDVDRALQLLGHSFPQLRIRRLTPYLVRVDAPAPATVP